MFPCHEEEKYSEEYDANSEGSYIIRSPHPVGTGPRLCWDATRHFNQIARYMNHAKKANAKPTHPIFIRQKWRIGFTASTDINEGDEVVWDYGVRGEVEWGSCKLVDGVVTDGEPGPSKQITAGPVMSQDTGSGHHVRHRVCFWLYKLY